MKPIMTKAELLKMLEPLSDTVVIHSVSGLSCSVVIEHLNNKYKADISKNELLLKFIERNYKMMEDYIQNYYHRTKDSTALNLWRKMNEH